MLHEIKADGFRLSVALDTILPNYHQIILALDKGRGGMALFIRPDFNILHNGSFPSSMAWAQVEGPLGSFFVGSVYEADTSLDRVGFWRSLNDNLPNEA